MYWKNKDKNIKLFKTNIFPINIMVIKELIVYNNNCKISDNHTNKANGTKKCCKCYLKE